MTTVPRSLTAPSVRLSHQAVSVFDPGLPQVWPAGQSEFTTQAKLPPPVHVPHVNCAPLSSIRPPPAAVFEAAPTHQSLRDASTTGVWAETHDPLDQDNRSKKPRTARAPGETSPCVKRGDRIIMSVPPKVA
jgi:hypothetical protein